MKFLLDQDVYAVTIHFLRDLGHDVVTAAEIGKARSSDSDLLNTAHKQKRIFVTRDRDFGELVFLRKIEAGVIYLRILPSTQKSVHEELRSVLNKYSKAQLSKAFIVVEPGRHRFRILSR